MLITRKHLSRRTLLRGAGVTLALPLLDSMFPALAPWAKAAAAPKVIAQVRQEPDQLKGFVFGMLADEAVRPSHPRGRHQCGGVIERGNGRVGVMSQEKTGDF